MEQGNLWWEKVRKAVRRKWSRDRDEIRSRARARRRHLAIYSEDIGAALLCTLFLQNLKIQFIQVNAILQNMLDEKELCNTQPISYSEENVKVDTLRNVEVENYWCKTKQGLEVLQIESDISIAQNDDDEAEIEVGVISERPEEPQIESKEDQPLVVVKPPTLPCIFVKPYTRVEVKERSYIFYTADTFVLDDHDMTDSFVLEVPNELPILKEGVPAALPKYVDAPFVVDISKREDIT
ncbi:hypothetical protein Syun_017048 [Stephania yunnanensis]|uniref:Uncharacterized protein n=1 Tax=Stephania yunnanensis TaxID=152371 RepID=A0AAP0J8H4_9MAGN